jgi:hypothetical protein
MCCGVMKALREGLKSYGLNSEPNSTPGRIAQKSEIKDFVLLQLTKSTVFKLATLT